jgi:hypothetical protein
MDKHYILIIGDGKTSRANTDALLEDYFYSKGNNVVLALAFEGKPSDGQIYAAQLAKDKSIDIVVFNIKNDAPGLPACSVIESANPIKDAIDHLIGKQSSVFFLWDGKSTDALTRCANNGTPAYDLTEGLNALSAPVISESTSIKPHTPTIQELEDLFTEPSSKVHPLEDKILDIVTKHLLSLAGVITEGVLNALDASNSPSKGV